MITSKMLKILIYQIFKKDYSSSRNNNCVHIYFIIQEKINWEMRINFVWYSLVTAQYIPYIYKSNSIAASLRFFYNKKAKFTKEKK